MKTNTRTLKIEKVVKETEKAILISMPVTWGRNSHIKNIWFPKSVISKIEEETIEAKAWFIDNAEAENEYNGYHMLFYYA